MTTLTKQEFEILSDFRYQLRRFLRFSEDASREEGVTVLQYLTLLHIRGTPGRNHATIGELAERLQAKHHGAVALVQRCEALGLVRRKAGTQDRRQVDVYLTRRGDEMVERIALKHRNELKSLQAVFRLDKLVAFNDQQS